MSAIPPKGEDRFFAPERLKPLRQWSQDAVDADPFFSAVRDQTLFKRGPEEPFYNVYSLLEQPLAQWEWGHIRDALLQVKARYRTNRYNHNEDNSLLLNALRATALKTGPEHNLFAAQVLDFMLRFDGKGIGSVSDAWPFKSELNSALTEIAEKRSDPYSAEVLRYHVGQQERPLSNLDRINLDAILVRRKDLHLIPLLGEALSHWNIFNFYGGNSAITGHYLGEALDGMERHVKDPVSAEYLRQFMAAVVNQTNPPLEGWSAEYISSPRIGTTPNSYSPISVLKNRMSRGDAHAKAVLEWAIQQTLDLKIDDYSLKRNQLERYRASVGGELAGAYLKANPSQFPGNNFVLETAKDALGRAHDWQARAIGLALLEGNRSPEAGPMLKGAVEDPDFDLRDQAKKMLEAFNAPVPAEPPAPRRSGIFQSLAALLRKIPA